MNIAQKIADLATPDRTIAMTRVNAEAIGCSEWVPGFNKCNRRDGVCFCRDGAEAVERIVLGRKS